MSQILSRKISDVVSVYGYAAAVEFVESHQQFDDGGLACACRSDDGYTLSRLCLECEIVYHRFVCIVSEGHMIECHLTFHSSRRKCELRSCVDICLLFLIDEFEDPLSRCSCGLELVGYICHLGYRLVEVPDVLYECLYITDGYPAVDGEVSAQQADCHIRQIADEVGYRHHHA